MGDYTENIRNQKDYYENLVSRVKNLNKSRYTSDDITNIDRGSHQDKNINNNNNNGIVSTTSGPTKTKIIKKKKIVRKIRSSVDRDSSATAMVNTGISPQTITRSR